MDGSGAPAWLQDILSNMQITMTALGESQANAFSSLSSRLDAIEQNPRRPTSPRDTIDELRARIAELEIQSTSNTTPVTAPVQVARPYDSTAIKQKMPPTEKFDGEDPAAFPQFQGNLMAKLRIDAAAIGDEENRVWYAFGRLTGTASKRIFPWMQMATGTPEFTVENLMSQMRTAFSDPRQQQKAMSRLNSIKQGNRSLREFLSEFDRLILEAQGWAWADNVKKGYLKAAVALRILEKMVGVEEKEQYSGYCDQLRMVDDQIHEISEVNRRKVFAQEARAARAATTGTAHITGPDAMEWEPSATASVGNIRARAAWVSKEEIQRRKTGRLCFRCGDAGHAVAQCLQLPAIRPAGKTTVLRAAPAVVVKPIPGEDTPIEELSENE